MPQETFNKTIEKTNPVESNAADFCLSSLRNINSETDLNSSFFPNDRGKVSNTLESNAANFCLPSVRNINSQTDLNSSSFSNDRDRVSNTLESNAADFCLPSLRNINSGTNLNSSSFVKDRHITDTKSISVPKGPKSVAVSEKDVDLVLSNVTACNSQSTYGSHDKQKFVARINQSSKKPMISEIEYFGTNPSTDSRQYGSEYEKKYPGKGQPGIITQLVSYDPVTLDSRVHKPIPMQLYSPVPFLPEHPACSEKPNNTEPSQPYVTTISADPHSLENGIQTEITQIESSESVLEPSNRVDAKYYRTYSTMLSSSYSEQSQSETNPIERYYANSACNTNREMERIEILDRETCIEKSRSESSDSDPQPFLDDEKGHTISIMPIKEEDSPANTAEPPLRNLRDIERVIPVPQSDHVSDIAVSTPRSKQASDKLVVPSGPKERLTALSTPQSNRMSDRPTLPIFLEQEAGVSLRHNANQSVSEPPDLIREIEAKLMFTEGLSKKDELLRYGASKDAHLSINESSRAIHPKESQSISTERDHPEDSLNHTSDSKGSVNHTVSDSVKNTNTAFHPVNNPNDAFCPVKDPNDTRNHPVNSSGVPRKLSLDDSSINHPNLDHNNQYSHPPETPSEDGILKQKRHTPLIQRAIDRDSLNIRTLSKYFQKTKEVGKTITDLCILPKRRKREFHCILRDEEVLADYFEIFGMPVENNDFLSNYRPDKRYKKGYREVKTMDNEVKVPDCNKKEQRLVKTMDSEVKVPNCNKKEHRLVKTMDSEVKVPDCNKEEYREVKTPDNEGSVKDCSINRSKKKSRKKKEASSGSEGETDRVSEISQNTHGEVIVSDDSLKRIGELESSEREGSDSSDLLNEGTSYSTTTKEGKKQQRLETLHSTEEKESVVLNHYKGSERSRSSKRFKKENFNDTPTGIQSDTPNGVQRDTPNGVQRDTSNGIQSDTPNGIQSDTPNGVQSDILNEIQSDTDTPYVSYYTKNLTDLHPKKGEYIENHAESALNSAQGPNRPSNNVKGSTNMPNSVTMSQSASNNSKEEGPVNNSQKKHKNRQISHITPEKNTEGLKKEGKILKMHPDEMHKDKVCETVSEINSKIRRTNKSGNLRGIVRSKESQKNTSESSSSIESQKGREESRQACIMNTDPAVKSETLGYSQDRDHKLTQDNRGQKSTKGEQQKSTKGEKKEQADNPSLDLFDHIDHKNYHSESNSDLGSKGSTKHFQTDAESSQSGNFNVNTDRISELPTMNTMKDEDTEKEGPKKDNRSKKDSDCKISSEISHNESSDIEHGTGQGIQEEIKYTDSRSKKYSDRKITSDTTIHSIEIEHVTGRDMFDKQSHLDSQKQNINDFYQDIPSVSYGLDQKAIQSAKTDETISHYMLNNSTNSLQSKHAELTADTKEVRSENCESYVENKKVIQDFNKDEDESKFKLLFRDSKQIFGTKEKEPYKLKFKVSELRDSKGRDGTDQKKWK